VFSDFRSGKCCTKTTAKKIFTNLASFSPMYDKSDVPCEIFMSNILCQILQIFPFNIIYINLYHNFERSENFCLPNDRFRSFLRAITAIVFFKKEYIKEIRLHKKSNGIYSAHSRSHIHLSLFFFLHFFTRFFLDDHLNRSKNRIVFLTSLSS